MVKSFLNCLAYELKKSYNEADVDRYMARLLKYDPRQPRDQRGRWTDGFGTPREVAYYRKPNNGARGSGFGRNAAVTAATYDSADYENIVDGSKQTTQRRVVGGIREKSRLQDHVRRHLDNVGARTEKEYQSKGTEFLAKPLNKTSHELLCQNGKIHRYDFASNEFGTVNADGNMSTYFKPDRKERFWLEQVVYVYRIRKR